MVRLICRAALLASVIGAAAPALAQDAAAPAAPAATVQEGASWAVVCPEADNGAAEGCSMIHNLLVGDGVNNQRLLTVMIQPDGEDGHTLVLALPHGLYIPAGVQVDVDDGAATQVQIQTSDSSGAYGGAPLTPELLSTMRGGSEMNVTMMSVDQQGLSVPVSLQGFSAAYDQMQQGVPTAP